MRLRDSDGHYYPSRLSLGKNRAIKQLTETEYLELRVRRHRQDGLDDPAPHEARVKQRLDTAAAVRRRRKSVEINLCGVAEKQTHGLAEPCG